MDENRFYKMGQLLAVLENLLSGKSEELSARSVRAMVDKAFGNPQASIPYLLRESVRYADEKTAQLVAELTDGNEDFPTSLKNTELGNLELGYFHQKAELKKQD